MEKSAAQVRDDLRRIFFAAVAAVDPAVLVARRLRRDGDACAALDDGREVARWTGAAVVVGAGKAAARMAEGCERALGPESVRGIAIVPDGYGASLRSIRAMFAGHPLPDARGEEATRRLCDLLAATESGPVLALVSGGASSLLVRTRPPVTLAEKQGVTQALLGSGAPIDSVNAVRKHLSLVKGGGLLRATAARPFISLMLSDVVGDAPSVIGSGPAVPDPTTFDDALRVLGDMRLDTADSRSVAKLLRRGARGEIEETVKPGDPEMHGAYSLLVGSNRDALEGAAAAAGQIGYDAIIDGEPLVGDTATCAKAWIDRVLAVAESAASRPLCMIAGGETTVRVRGPGRGGRNQEFALALVDGLEGASCHVLSAGTDGIDGPTDAAGAFVDGSTARRSRAHGLDSRRALDRNDSYGFFSATGDLFSPGPTGTNVMDIKIALALPLRQALSRDGTLC
jgi:hydroxypyruvate reductase